MVCRSFNNAPGQKNSVPFRIHFARVYLLFGLQCPLQFVSRRESAWHWVLSAGTVGAMEVQAGHMSTSSSAIKEQLKGLKEGPAYSRGGILRGALKFVKTPHACFLVYGAAGGVFARLNGIPW